MYWQKKEEFGGYSSKKTALPVVYITPEARQRLDLYIQTADGEISGLGTVTRLGNDFLITAVHLFEQECTGASTELSSEDVSKFLLEAVRADIDPSGLKMWWHSHSNMGAFWSGTDEITASSFSNGWMLSLVGNKRGEYRIRLDIYEPLRITLDELELQLHYPENNSLRQEVEAEVKEKVRVKTKVYAFPYHYDLYEQGDWPYGQSFRSRRERWEEKKKEEEKEVKNAGDGFLETD
jgi:hypothetical protein